MAVDNVENFVYGVVTVAPSPADSGTELSIGEDDADVFPDPSSFGEYDVVVWPTNTKPLVSNAEIVRITAKAAPSGGNVVLTITRTQQDSTARSIVVGDQIAMNLTAKTINDIISMGTSSMVRNEIPGGTINGSNTSFTTAADFQTGSLRVYQNGVRLKGGGEDYTATTQGFTMITAPLTGDILLVDYETNATGFATGSTSFIYNEVPSGTINGSNTSFTLEHTPVSGTLQIERDGQAIYQTDDWTLSGATITFVTAPATGTTLRAHYQKSLSVAGNADTTDGYHANNTPTAGQIPVLDSAMAMIGGGMNRQAIMNGNFDVWQRGTSHTTFTDATVTLLADRWYDLADDDGGTKPTLTRSRQALTVGDIPGSFYFSRLNSNGAGSSFGAAAFHMNGQKIEYGTRFLCGNEKKVTLSFYAKSDIANKKLGIYLVQGYGTGGSPTSAEVLTGTNWTLTSTWTKYTHTFTTNTLVGKTFGTANDDSLDVRFNPMWGTGTSATRVGSTGVAESYVGSGNIDIAQVQLCAGDVALPFQPKSFEEELMACMRYYEHSYNYGTVPGTSSVSGYVYFQGYAAVGNGSCYGYIPFKVRKRAAAPTVVYRGYAGGTAVCSNAGAGADLAANSAVSYAASSSEHGVVVYNNSGGNITPTAGGFIMHYTCQSEL